MKKREIKPMLKQNRKNQIDNSKGAKKGFRYKAAAAAFAIMGAFMLASCSFEPNVPQSTPPTVEEQGPVHSQVQEINYDNGFWSINLAGFTSQEKAEEVAGQLSNGVDRAFSVETYEYNEEVFWNVVSTSFNIDQINILSLLSDKDIYCAVYGPCENVELTNLTLEEFKNIYTNIDVSWGNITISQEQSPNNDYNIGYKIAVSNIKKTDADTLISLVSDKTKVKSSHNSRKVFTGESTVNDVIDIFNVDKNDLTATYVDNYGSVDSFLSVIGDDLSNTKITKIIDVDGQEITTHAEPELGL